MSWRANWTGTTIKSAAKTVRARSDYIVTSGVAAWLRSNDRDRSSLIHQSGLRSQHARAALQQLAKGGTFRTRIGKAAHCIAKLSVKDFPCEVTADVTLLFSIRGHIRHFGEYPIYSYIPIRLARESALALHRIYKLLMIAKGVGLALSPTESRKIDEVCRKYVGLL